MSTIDPVQVRAERIARLRRSPLRPAALVTVLALSGLAAALTGAGIVAMLDSMRISKLNGVFAGWDSRLDSWFWMFPVGLCAVLGLGLLSTVLARSAPGARLRYPVVGPIPVAAVGAAVGVTLACPQMTAPVVVGTRTDPTFGDDEAWGTTHWIWYRVDVWWPILAWVLALLALAIAVEVRRRHRARTARIADLLETGRIVSGEVTATSRLTVRFIDAAGTDRWTRPPCTIPVAEQPATGTQVAVLCDPEAPADESRIFVGPRGARSVEEFVRWLT